MATVPLAFHFEYHNFDVLSVDGVVLLGGSAALGVLAGLLAHRSPEWARVLGLSAVTILFLDLQFNPNLIIAYRWLVPGIFLVVWVLRRHYTRIATVSVAAMLATLPFRGSPRSVETWTAAEDKPISPASPLVPIVHIILDEHASPSSFPADVPEAARARKRILEFYRRHQFRLFERAYSRHFLTRYSIPEILSPADPGQAAPAAVKLKQDHYRMSDAKLFAWASSAGYRVHVLQSDYLDICGERRAQLASCRTYRANSLRSLQLLRLDPPHRILIESLYFVTSESYLARKAIWAMRTVQAHALGGRWPDQMGMSATHRAQAGMVLRELQGLRDRIRGGLEGEYQFAHLMLPHFPYEVDATCRGHQEIGKRLQPGWHTMGRWGKTPDGRRLAWALHAAQLECLYIYLDSLITVIDSVAPPQGVLVVLHGDHGSRITPFVPRPATAARLTDEIVMDSYATLLAVRGPGLPAGVEPAPLAVQDGVFGLITGDSLISLRAMSPTPVVTLDDVGDGKGHAPLTAPVLAGRASVSQSRSNRPKTAD